MTKSQCNPNRGIPAWSISSIKDGLDFVSNVETLEIDDMKFDLWTYKNDNYTKTYPNKGAINHKLP